MPFYIVRRCVCALLFCLSLATVSQAQVPSGFTVDPVSREPSRILFNTIYQASENVPSGWTGNVSTGDAGTTSPSFRDAINLRVNYFRAMAGVPAIITFSDAFNAADQQAALMMSANGTLDHYPPTGWLDYTDAGAQAAANSNLALGTTEDGPSAIDGYVAEDGGNNDAVGHRRWLLYPPETTMGTGDVDGSGDGTTLGANALWVLDTATFADPAPTARDGFVAWPPPGYVPYTLVSPRWSFTLPGADFSAATVSLTRDGVSVPVQLLALDPDYGDNTLVWVPDNLDPSNPPAPVAPTVETATIVTVGNVLVAGVAQSFTYKVILFDPAATGPDTVTPAILGPTDIIASPIHFLFNAVPGATGYRWNYRTVTPFALDLDAENGPGDVTILPAGTDLITTAHAAHGNACYQFISEPPESLTVNASFMPAAGSTLAFNSQLDYASADETARVQISTDGGVTWNDLYTLAGQGTSGPTETAFGAHGIDLSAFAGESCTVRFTYVFDGNGGYFPRADQAGWYVDDITLTGVNVMSAPVVGDVAAGQLGFDFAPPVADGNYLLQVVPVFFGQYEADAGPVFAVTAIVASSPGPMVTVAATMPQAQAGGGGGDGEFTITRAGDDLSQKVVVHFLLKGLAVNGTDYAWLPGKVALKAGQASKAIAIVPLPGGGSGKVKLVLQAGNGYVVGDPAGAKVKIAP